MTISYGQWAFVVLAFSTPLLSSAQNFVSFQNDFQIQSQEVGPRLSADQLKTGLRLLFKNANCSEKKYCLETAENESVLIENALNFKTKLDQTIQRAHLTGFQWISTRGSIKEFEFDSPVQRDVSHPSNKVRGSIYFPTNYDFCKASYPATLLIHKLSVDIESEKQIASVASRMNMGLVMLIYLPHFGTRQKKDEKFITKNQNDFELNMLQALADIHMSYAVLKSLPHVQQDNIGLMGLSLGGMTSLISAGLDPIFDRYATNVGGGDLANIVTYRKTGDVDTQTGQVLKDIDWSVDQARFVLSSFDAITWSQNVKNKKILMINAFDDELINRSLSIDPLIEGYAQVGSKVNLILHKGTHVFHVRETGIWKSFTKVMLPMLNFVGTNTPSDTQCKANDF